MIPGDINIRITGKAAADLRHLAQQLGVATEDVVTDALRLLRTSVDNGLYVAKGRLTQRAPALYALGFWSQIMDQGATGRIEVNTRHGPAAFRLPPEAFHKSTMVGTYTPPMWGAQGTPTQGINP
jgi:hypothetical protein